jgi:hypothetical protein
MAGRNRANFRGHGCFEPGRLVHMKNSLRALIILFVFCLTAWYTSRLVTTHTEESNTPASQLRLAGAMAGLFAGGAAAMFVGIVFISVRRD